MVITLNTSLNLVSVVGSRNIINSVDTFTNLPYPTRRLLSTNVERSFTRSNILRRLYFDKGLGTFLEFNVDLGAWFNVDDSSAADIISDIIGERTTAAK